MSDDIKELNCTVDDCQKRLLIARIEALEAQLAAAREALEKAEYASRKDSLTESERLSCVRTVVCAAISKLAALGKATQ